MKTQALAAAAALLALAACGGGSHTLSPATTQTQTNFGTAQYSLMIPNAAATASGARKATYVSPSTLSASITVGSIAHDYDLGVSSPSCTSVTGGRACSISVPAAIGTTTASLVLYDGACTGGPPCSHSGQPLSIAQNIPITIVEGRSNVPIPLILGGVPNTVDVTAALVSHSSATVPLIVTAYDIDNNVIVGPAPFATSGGATMPIVLTINTYGTTVAMHDGGQAGPTINVAGPADSVTIQLGGNADVLGVPLRATFNAARMSGNQTRQFLPVSGTLTSTLIMAGTVTDEPDYYYVSHTDASSATGVPNGLAFSFGTQSSGDEVGWFDSDTEQSKWCAPPGFFNQGVTAVAGGLVVGYNADWTLQTLPTGLQFIPAATITGGGSCGTANRQATGHLARDLGWDQTNSQILDYDNDNSFRYETLTGTVIGVPTTQLTQSGFGSFYAYGGIRYWINNGTSLYEQAYPGGSSSFTTGSTLSSVTIGEDARAYVLDSGSGKVYAIAGFGAPQQYGTGTFSSAASSGHEVLAIGPDGTAYTTDGSSAILTLTSGGTANVYSIPAPGGNIGNVQAVFDGHNGYVYAYYADGPHAGAQYFFRISN